MRAIGLVILSALAVPFLTFGADTNSTQTCDQYIASVQRAHPQDQQSAAGNTAIQNIPANTPPEKVPQLGHKETNDQVIVNADGSIKVLSSCGLKGQIGTIVVCTFDKDGKQTCGVKIPKDKEDVVAAVTGALQKGTGQDVQKSLKDLAEEYKTKAAESTGALPSLNRSQVLDAFRKAGVRDPEGAIRDLQNMGFGNEAEELLRAAARGDDRTVQEIIRKAESYQSSWPESFQRFKKNAFLEALDETRTSTQSAQNAPDYFSALRTPSYTGFQVDTPVTDTGSTGDLANARGLLTVTGVASAYNPLTPGGWREGGRTTATGEPYNPNEYSAAIQLSIAERLQMAHGKYPRVGYALVEYEDKQLVVKLNDNGPLVRGRVIDLNEASMRYLSGGRYDGHNGLLSNVKVTVLDGAYPPGPVVNGKIIADAPPISTADLNYPNYLSGVSNRGSEPWCSPGTYNGNSGYNGSDGSISSLGNLFSGFSGGASSVAPSGSIAPTVTAPPAPPTNQPPSSNNPSPSTTPAAITHPVIAFSGAQEIDKGDSLLVVWAATGVSTTQTCTLLQNGEAVAEGNSSTFFVPISAVYPDDSIIFTLECTPFDPRAPQSEARKELKVLVR